MGRGFYLLAAVLTSVGVTPASAEEPKSGAEHCVAIPSDLERLQCFDDWAHAQGFAGSQPALVPVEGAGDWQVQRSKNPIDDTETVVLSVESTSGVARFGERPILAIQCRSGRAQIGIFWHAYIAPDRPEVVTRIGAEKAERLEWHKANTNTTVILPDSLFSKFLRRILNAATMVAEITPYSDPRITATFNITGLRNAIQPLAAACKLSF